MSLTLIIIVGFILIAAVGFFTLFSRYEKSKNSYEFAHLYRDKFIQLANIYMKGFDSFDKFGPVDPELYTWLTKNASKIQEEVGSLGIMNYIAPYRIYQIKNYEVIINTLPKFRNHQVQNLDIHSVDDCLLRYSGIIERFINTNRTRLGNPLIWFREGFRMILSLPFYFFNWFGLLSDRSVGKITTNNFYSFLAAIGSLVTFVSGVVTIIQGKEQTIALIKRVFGY